MHFSASMATKSKLQELPEKIFAMDVARLMHMNDNFSQFESRPEWQKLTFNVPVVYMAQDEMALMDANRFLGPLG
jgi:hypothetical protein